ncbi:MAG: diguanylate cyclase [Nitrosomonadales bacterium]
MSTPLTPPEIARDTLKTLATRKLVPTPDNYARVYHEISGATGGPAESTSPAKDQLKSAPAWPKLIRDLLKQMDTPHKGITVTRKKDGVETVLTKFSSNSDTLFEKLQGLMHSWSEAPTASSLGDINSISPESAAVPLTTPAVTAVSPGAKVHAEMVLQLRELLAQTLESSLTTQPDLASEIQALARQARATSDFDQTTHLSKQLRQYWIKLELRESDKAKIQEGVVRLLRLLVENVGELASDDQWLHGQIATLQEIIIRPMDKRTIADAERNLRNAIIKQGFLKQSLVDAKTTLKNLMTTFIDRLGEVTEQTGEYHLKIAEYSQKIGGTNNLTELSHLLDDIMRDTREVQASAQRSHEDLIITRKKAHEAEERVKQLEEELEQVSEKMHEDQLTGALNRRGMDEAMDREIKRADRQRTPISLALLDIDNFKQLNDTLGHQAGDHALVHLTAVIKETLRPTDAVARYGGEEFIIIMSETSQEEAMATIIRLQRELTKKFFLHNNERKLITFSAGVALRADNETGEDVMARADKAMYQAKKAGKNRVVAAD